MTSLERNADIVQMATYAPLFAHVDGWQWRPDLIWYDNLRSFRSVSYYVQQMYAKNKGTNVLPLTMDGKPVAGQEGQDGLFASSVFDKATGEVIVKIINTSKVPQPVTLSLLGMKGTPTAQTLTLVHHHMDDENTLEQPEKIIPHPGSVACEEGKKGATLTDELPPVSFRLYRIK